MTSQPPWIELTSKSPRSSLSGSIKLLYHMMAVPFLGGITRLAIWQLILKLNSSDSGFGSSWVKFYNKVLVITCTNIWWYITNLLFWSCSIWAHLDWVSQEKQPIRKMQSDKMKKIRNQDKNRSLGKSEWSRRHYLEMKFESSITCT